MNKRFYIFTKNQKKITIPLFGKHDMIFVSETNLAYDTLPIFENYTIIADPKIKSCTFGGIAWYIKCNLAKHVFQVTLDPSFISFRLDIVPDYVFIGVYIQPEGARYFNVDMFAKLGASLIEFHEKGLTPFIGGDFNSRPGDLRQFGCNNSWNYEENRDKISNKHGRTYFRDLCYAGHVRPVNGLKYRGLNFDNDFTYIRKNGKSQIDFCLTSSHGKSKIINFEIVASDFHISDHRPITLVVEISSKPVLTGIYKRSVDLNYEYNPICTDICKFRGVYDYDTIQNKLVEKKFGIENGIYEKLQDQDIDGAIDLLEEHIKSAHKGTKKFENIDITPVISMETVNNAFDEYIIALSDNTISESDTQELLNRYITTRKSITKEMMNVDLNKWNHLLRSNDTKSFWRYVDWKGSCVKKGVFIYLFILCLMSAFTRHRLCGAIKADNIKN